ncbi:uncharacterized protein TNCT_95561 [Trichonephila clavata]|uniref:Uncharacterized protein n=1 Tax=Trichonephila clavata TaxID=2740835 RepID=A0A8X6KK78_TRICU|nr:uncharacterized protein TNCT_95561 [Trichonephila clavata]
MDITCQQGTVQAGGGPVMVWGVCSWRDVGLLIRLDTTLTGDRYVSILSDYLHPFMTIISAGQCDTPPFQNCYRVAPGVLLLILTLPLSTKIPRHELY